MKSPHDSRYTCGGCHKLLDYWQYMLGPCPGCLEKGQQAVRDENSRTLIEKHGTQTAPAGMPAATRYLTDPMFHNLVASLEAYIHQAHFTPTEVREAAVLACIHYEERKRWENHRYQKIPNL